MNKTTKSIPQKETPPSSLWHYTSFEALTQILDPNKAGVVLRFHLSNPLQTNDKKEVHFFDNYVYTGKIGKELKLQMDIMTKKIGMPFTLSFIQHKESKKSYPACEIPMWRMYGNQFKGVRLKFNYTKMSSYYKSQTIGGLVKCNYQTVTEMRKKGQDIRNRFKQSDADFNLEDIYKAAVCYKTYDWEYENEWRLIAWCNDIKKMGFYPQSGKLYIPYEIPLDFLETIEIGPKADYEAYEASLQLIKQKLGNSSDNHFTIKKSKLDIGYV